MISDFIELMPLWAFVAAFVVTMGAGVIKGAIGFGLPLVIMSGLALFLDPLIALAGVILPALVSNVVQVIRHPRADVVDAVKEHWRYIVIVCVVILIVAQLVTLAPRNMFYLILGVPVVVLSLIQLFGVRFSISANHRRTAEWIMGGMAGALGGVTGSWGVPTVLYLIALETPKARQLLVQGVIYSIGSLALIAGHVQSGILNATTVWFSAFLLIPTFLGMRIGFMIGDRLDAELFRRVTLIVLVVAGANLVRRGLFG